MLPYLKFALFIIPAAFLVNLALTWVGIDHAILRPLLAGVIIGALSASETLQPLLFFPPIFYFLPLSFLKSASAFPRFRSLSFRMYNAIVD